MEFLFDNDRPIYVQLVETLRTAIVSGAVPPGARLPSVRELSTQAQVNPNTMQRALGQLEDDGLIYTERTNGKFVTLDAGRIAAEKTKLANEKAAAFLAEMAKLGCTADEIRACLLTIGGENEWHF